MKILVRCVETNLFYAGDGRWVQNSGHAFDFRCVEDAVQACREQRMVGMEVVLSYPGSSL